ncbi:hypothetical protein C8R48DRAFT_764732 [Suillus tomentosus]|nr:hypothetical protein C8R48DRAFT_764732 [Suillus tomentosus]
MIDEKTKDGHILGHNIFIAFVTPLSLAQTAFEGFIAWKSDVDRRMLSLFSYGKTRLACTVSTEHSYGSALLPQNLQSGDRSALLFAQDCSFRATSTTSKVILDFSVLDHHWGTIDDWVNFVDTVHACGMYIMLDFTVGILSDLIGFEGNVLYIHQLQSSLTRPPVYSMPSIPVTGYDGCHESDFDQYGDMDRLCEWKPFVMDKLTTFSCMTIIALDIDAIRVDKNLARNLAVVYDLNINFVTAWNRMFVNNDFLNTNTGLTDPRHSFGTNNFDVFRWPSLANGTLRSASHLISHTCDYFYHTATLGRQAMMSNKAWQRHGCYRLGSAQYFNMPLESALPGCDDDWNSLDHFYPTTDTHRSEFSRIILTTKQSTIDNSSESFKLSQNTLPKETRSLPYGRNWSFLWSIPIPKWAIVLLIIFFIGVWAFMLYIFTSLSKTHTWFLPVSPVGLDAPRWYQTSWGTSFLALYIPWAGSGGPYLGLPLWFWMPCKASVIGSICVMAARATESNRIGPGSAFPDVRTWDFLQGLKGSPMASTLFWIALIC